MNTMNYVHLMIGCSVLLGDVLHVLPIIGGKYGVSDAASKSQSPTLK